MRTANNLFRKVHNYTHFKGWFTQFQRKCNILEIFHYFQYFERFRSMKKWQISKPKIVDWYLDFSKESYTTLKSVISSFKICFQNYGKLKRGQKLQLVLFWNLSCQQQQQQSYSGLRLLGRSNSTYFWIFYMFSCSSRGAESGQKYSTFYSFNCKRWLSI